MTKCSHGKTENCFLCKLEKAASKALGEVLEEGDKANG